MGSVMNKSMKQHKGMTLISMIVVIVFLLFLVVIAMNVLPVYLTDSTVKSVMTELPDDAKVRGLSAKELKSTVAKRLNINSVYSIKPKQIKVKKHRDESVVTIEYEPRGTLIGNLDYIVSFKHEAKIPKR
jgi:competence protein ComGC